MIPIDQDLDEEISTVELRIHERTLRVVARGHRIGTALQRSLTSPAVLLLAAGTGFAIGRITEGNGAPGQTRISRAWISISQGVRAALAIVRTPAFVWLARLLAPNKPESPRPTAVRNGADRSSTASFTSAPHS